MAYVMGNVVLSTAATIQQMFRMPAGLCNVTFWNNSPAATVYVGVSTTVTSVNGLVCHSIPTSFYQYVSSGGTNFYGTVSSGPATVSYIIVTDQLRRVAMTILMGGATVPSSSTVAAFNLPPGYSNFTVYQSSGRAQVYIGTSNTVSTANGLYVPLTPLTQETYVGSAGATVYATTGGTAASSFHYILSTTN